jgi:hypothetical protein
VRQGPAAGRPRIAAATTASRPAPSTPRRMADKLRASFGGGGAAAAATKDWEEF